MYPIRNRPEITFNTELLFGEYCYFFVSLLFNICKGLPTQCNATNSHNVSSICVSKDAILLYKKYTYLKLSAFLLFP